MISAAPTPADAPDNPNGPYCKVLGSIHPVDPAAPDIRFEINLPDDWNRKALHYGGGDTTDSSPDFTITRSALPGSPTPLKRGYVTFGSDSGHQNPSVADGSFAMNTEALVNFGGAQFKKTTMRRSSSFFYVTAQDRREPTSPAIRKVAHEGFIVIQRWPQRLRRIAWHWT